MASLISVSNETKASFSRKTRDGRSLIYELSVLQQPQRARACGSGAKSSADRRPVDPPPVVELKVLDAKDKTDITFSHNANFFLYTTLESARQIAPMRGNPVPTPQPVLTGMPVAGMAYLDRPTQAGYFIFPDLSVRHEGKYRLNFSLFEELKDNKDMDVESPNRDTDQPHRQMMTSPPMLANSHVHFRLEVKSEPFTVFSAKKFPGLTESTNLSRVVAEQGCRVRIRRDVRMRRRETKKDFEDEEEQAPAPSLYNVDRYTTPDSYAQHAQADRARSVSNVSVAVDSTNATHYGAERRPSGHESTYYQQPSYQPPPASAPQPAPSGYQSHLSFGSQQAPQYQAPPAAAPYAAPSSSYPYSQPAAPHARQMSNGSANYPNYNAHQPYSQPQYQQSQPAYSEALEYRRSNGSLNTTTGYASSSSSNRDSYPLPAVDQRYTTSPSLYQSPSQVSDPRSSTPNNVTLPQLPPLKLGQPERKFETAPASINIPIAASPSSPVSAYDTYSTYSTQPPPASAGGKRAYGKVFETNHLNQSTSQGARVDAAGVDVLQVETEEGLIDQEDMLNSMRMLTYRRADGSRQHKKVPSPV